LTIDSFCSHPAVAFARTTGLEALRGRGEDKLPFAGCFRRRGPDDESVRSGGPAAARAIIEARAKAGSFRLA
jgi:hypothetical protein